MSVQIVESGRFKSPVLLSPGDDFKLWHRGDLVHTFDISKVQSVSMWACIKIADLAVGYMLGGDDLLEVLEGHFNECC